MVLPIIYLDIIEIEIRYSRRAVYTIPTKELSRGVRKWGKVIGVVALVDLLEFVHDGSLENRSRRLVEQRPKSVL